MLLGAKKVFQPSASIFMPASRKVGSEGAKLARFLPDTARMRILPATCCA